VKEHEAVTAAWERTLELWDDAARHEALLALVVEHNAFAWAAGRYKERGDDPIAKARLEQLQKAAIATMMASASTRKTEDRSPSTKLAIWLAVMVAMLLVGLLFAGIVVNGSRKNPSGAGARGVRPVPAAPRPVQRPTGARH
jgi:hypothetical protein